MRCSAAPPITPTPSSPPGPQPRASRLHGETLANSVEEARVVRAKYLERRNKVATQVGMQRHAYENFNCVRELIHDGAIGELQQVSAWGNRQIRRAGYLPADGEPPSDFHYDLWTGRRRFIRTTPAISPAAPG